MVAEGKVGTFRTMMKRQFMCDGLGCLFVLILVSVITGCGGGGAVDGGRGNNSATLSWDPSTTNADGTLITNLAGYKIYYGTLSNTYTGSIDVGSATCNTECSYTIEGLSPGEYYFTVIAYDTSGIESGYSNEVSKTFH
jgi:hypothetical protein